MLNSALVHRCPLPSTGRQPLVGAYLGALCDAVAMMPPNGRWRLAGTANRRSVSAESYRAAIK
jgi:hypothetical protein